MTDDALPILVGSRDQTIIGTDEHSRREFVVRPAYHPEPLRQANGWYWTVAFIVVGAVVIVCVLFASSLHT